VAPTQAPVLSVQRFQHYKRGGTFRERSAAHSRFNDLWHMLGELTPTDADPACGSGNFLCGALAGLNDLEKEVVTYGAGNGHCRFCLRWRDDGQHVSEARLDRLTGARGRDRL
jgi:hypothetical protein